VHQRLRGLIRAVDVFGFHLAAIDLRQSSDQHEQVIAELLKLGGVEEGYVSLAEGQKQELLLRLLNEPRVLRIPGGNYSEHTQSEMEIFEVAKRMHELYGKDAIRHYIISHTETVSDLLEVLLLQKEVGLMQGTLKKERLRR